MISVYLCEDDKRQLEQYSRLIHRFLDFEGYEEMPVYEFRDPHALLNAAEKNGGTGLYFLDIQLNSDINGLENWPGRSASWILRAILFFLQPTVK